MAVAVGIFVVALAAIATERVERATVALLGASLLVVVGTVDQEGAIASVDFNTIGLLVGMMIMVRLTEATGVFGALAIRAAQASGGRSFAVVCSLAVTTAMLSAFLDNVTTVLLVVPITFVLADTLDIDAVPLVLLEVFASNLGGTATMIGDPPNIIIAGHTGLSFGAFLVNLAPVVVVSLLVVVAGVYLAFRCRLRVTPAARARVMELRTDQAVTDPREARLLVPILVAATAMFFFHRPLGLEPATVALGGASVMLLVTRREPHEVIAGVDWSTLFFLAGLFVVVGGLEATGVLGAVADGLTSLTAGDRQAELLSILWAAGAGSAVVDNIPFTAAMLPVVDQVGGTEDSAYWWALALGACFGGNATVIAAAANVAASGLAARAGTTITFGAFLRAGLPVTVVSLTIATAYVLVRYA